MQCVHQRVWAPPWGLKMPPFWLAFVNVIYQKIGTVSKLLGYVKDRRRLSR